MVEQMKSAQTLEEVQQENAALQRALDGLCNDLSPVLIAHMTGNRDEVARRLDGLLKKVQIEVFTVTGAAGSHPLH